MDILASWKISEAGEEVHTETIAQDIKVLAVDQESTSDKKKAVVVRSVTLEMTPQQAEDVFKKQMQGSIQLALRNPTDTTMYEKVQPLARVEEPQPSIPKSSPNRGRTFTVIRGMSLSKVQCKGFVCSEQ